VPDGKSWKPTTGFMIMIESPMDRLSTHNALHYLSLYLLIGVLWQGFNLA